MFTIYCGTVSMQFVSNLLGGILVLCRMFKVRGGRFFFGWIIKGSYLVGMYSLNLASVLDTWVVDRARYISLSFLA